MKRILICSFIILASLSIDQYTKYWTRLNMTYGDYIPVLGNWFYLHFIENNGMAYGFEFGGRWGKLFLTSFRVLFCIYFFYLVFIRAVRKKISSHLHYCLSIIFAGAIGNTVDCVLYGKIYGYEDWFLGRVVDMFYFPIIEVYIPEWIPYLGGNYFTFFEPVFNVADALISCGIVYFLFFNKSLLNELFDKKEKNIDVESGTEATPNSDGDKAIDMSVLEEYSDTNPGKFEIRVENFETLYEKIGDNPYLVDILIERMKSPNIQRISMWMLSHHVKQGYELNDFQTRKFINNLYYIELWPAIIYALGVITKLALKNGDTMELEKFVRESLSHKNSFVRASSLSAFWSFCKQRGDLLEELQFFCEKSLENDTKVVRARAKKILQEINQ